MKFGKRRQAFIMPMPSYFVGTTTFLTSKSTDELFVSDNLFPSKRRVIILPAPTSNLSSTLSYTPFQPLSSVPDIGKLFSLVFPLNLTFTASTTH